MQHRDRLNHYEDLLHQWQKTINLVSPMTLNDVWNRHFEDSLQILPHIPKNSKNICDIGSGAGFPGMVLAIECPSIHFHLIESDARKCAFLRTVSRETSCNNVTIHQGRIEDLIDEIQADIVTSRALASLRQLIVYAQKLWERNSDFQMVLPKGRNYQQEIDDALKKFQFECAIHPSITDPEARTLIVGNIIEK